MSIKHDVVDDQASERTHPLFDPLIEQREVLTQHLQDLKPRSFLLKVRGKPVKQGRTLDVKPPRLNPAELVMVEQEYLRRYFTPQHIVDEQLAQQRDLAAPSLTKASFPASMVTPWEALLS